MKTGMLAAETAFEAVRAGDTSARAPARLRASASTQLGARRSCIRCATCTRPSSTGCPPASRSRRLTVADRRAMAAAAARAGRPRRGCGRCAATTVRRERHIAASNRASKPDRVLTFDKVTDVHFSGTRHDEDQPVHLLVQTEVCHSICGPEYGHPCTALLPGERLRDRARRGGHAAPADQRVELRALQDVRHHGPVPGDHLGAARGRRRTAVRRPVTTPPSPDWKASRSKRLRRRPSARSGIPPSSARPDVAVACRGLEHLDVTSRRAASRSWRSGTGGSCRRSTSSAIATSSSSPAKLRRRMDGEDHPPVRLHDRPRIDIAQRGARGAEGEAADGRRAARRPHRRRTSRTGAGGAARRGVARESHRQSRRAVSHGSRVVLDRAELGRRADPPAVQPRRDGRGRAVLRAGRRRRRRHSRAYSAWSSKSA